MAFINTPDRFAIANQPAGSYPFTLRGGSYWVEFEGTGSGTVDLQRQSPDGSYRTNMITQITATAGQQTVTLPPGLYKLIIASFTANYVSLDRVPTAVE